MTLAALATAAASEFVAYDGATVPLGYGDVAVEHAALHGGVALLWQPQRRFLGAAGSERVEFLQGQLSNDVAGLGPGQGQAALLLSAQGKVEALVGAYAVGERIEIVSDAAHVETVAARIEKFLVADDVELEREPPTDSTVALAGPDAPALLSTLTGRDRESLARGWYVWAGEIAGISARVYSRGEFLVPYFEIVFDTDAAAAWSALTGAGAVPTGAQALEILRVESGVARYGIDVDESRIALEARLEWAIHFAKGCYVGQEIVERAVSRGRVNRRLALLSSSEPLEPGALLEGGAERDVVTSSVVSPAAGPLAFGYLDVERAVEGTEVLAAGRSARVLEWPRAEIHAGRRR